MPGMTISPSASIVCSAPERRPTSVTRPSLMPTSAVRIGKPDPSMTLPPLMIVSNAMETSLRCPADVLHLAVSAHRESPAVASDARAFVATEWGFGVRRCAVDLHGAGADAPTNADGARGVARPHESVEAVVRVVRDRHRLVLVLERDHGDHRAEDLFSSDRHGVRRVREQCRLVVVAAREMRRALAAAGEGRALFATLRDAALDSIALCR